MNAYEAEGKIIADMMQFEEAPMFPHLDGSRPDLKKGEARLNRWEIDISSSAGSIKKQYLDESIGEFPRLRRKESPCLSTNMATMHLMMANHPKG